MRLCYDPANGSGCGARHPNISTVCDRCGRSLRRGRIFWDPGDRVGERYQVRDLLGFGGGGGVYEAEDLRGQYGRVALKESFDEEGIALFADEFSALRDRQHDHLPTYHDLFIVDGHGYLIMELVRGQNLLEILEAEGRPLPEKLVLAYAVQICDVLGYLHSQAPPLYHRDIKPANCRLSPNGMLKLVDFGLFKHGGQATRQLIRQMGTPEYVPLEQIAGGETDARTDIFGLGATLYHLLTNRPPPMVTERLGKDTDPLAPPHQLNPNVSVAVSEAVLKAMQIEARRRWPDMAAFSAALFRQASPPAPAPPQPTPEPPQPASAPGNDLPWPQRSPAPAADLPWPEHPLPEQDGLSWPKWPPSESD